MVLGGMALAALEDPKTLRPEFGLPQRLPGIIWDAARLVRSAISNGKKRLLRVPNQLQLRSWVALKDTRLSNTWKIIQCVLRVKGFSIISMDVKWIPLVGQKVLACSLGYFSIASADMPVVGPTSGRMLLYGQKIRYSSTRPSMAARRSRSWVENFKVGCALGFNQVRYGNRVPMSGFLVARNSNSSSVPLFAGWMDTLVFPGRANFFPGMQASGN